MQNTLNTITNKNLTAIEIKNTLVEEKLKYYRQLAPANEPNNQEFNTGN